MHFFCASLLQTDLLKVADYPFPYPNKFKDAWDDVSVKMPCSEKNLFPVETEVYDSSSSRLCMPLRNMAKLSELFVLRRSRRKLSFGFCSVGWRWCPESVGPYPDFLANRIQELSGRQGKTDMKSRAEYT